MGGNFMDKKSLDSNLPFYIDNQGRYRDKSTHRYVRKEIVNKFLNSEQVIEKDISISERVKDATRKYLLQTVRNEGYDVADVSGAWGLLIETQTRIALDPEKGSKATSAAKFIGTVAGFLVDVEEPPQKNKKVLGIEIAQKIITMILEEGKGNG